MAEVQVARHLCTSSMVKYFESLPDPRDERNRRHLLVEVVIIAICGIIVGFSGPTTMARWAKAIGMAVRLTEKLDVTLFHWRMAGVS